MNSAAALSQYFEQLEDYAMVFLDPDGYVVRANRGASLLKGYTREEIVGIHFSRFYTPEANAVGHPERELAVAAALSRYEEEGWRVRKDNTRFWAHIIITPMFDEHEVLRGFAKILRDITQQKQNHEQSINVMNLLDLTARTDYLTGLENRRSFDKQLAAAISNARRDKRPISLAMIDLDHFKDYNDAFGHFAGDCYLKQAPIAWRKALRPDDFLARYGGEEFVVLLFDTNAFQALACLDRLRLATPPALTCSIGIAQWRETESASVLIGRADRALYQAKSSGRNRIVLAAEPPRIDLCQDGGPFASFIAPLPA